MIIYRNEGNNFVKFEPYSFQLIKTGELDIEKVFVDIIDDIESPLIDIDCGSYVMAYISSLPHFKYLEPGKGMILFATCILTFRLDFDLHKNVIKAGEIVYVN